MQLSPLHCLMQMSMYDQADVIEDTDMPKELQQLLLQGLFDTWRNGKLKEKSLQRG